MAARLSESLSIAFESPVITTHITLSGPGSAAERAVPVLTDCWKRVTRLRGLAIHRSVSGDALLAHCQWGDSMQDSLNGTASIVCALRECCADGVIESHVLTLDTLRRGRAPGIGEFTLDIASHSTRPVLVAAFEPLDRNALLEYLHEAGARFAEQVPGWHGAALYCDTDGRRVVEYLLFQSMEGVAASQSSPLIQQHQAALRKFGPMKADLFRVQDVLRRRTD